MKLSKFFASLTSLLLGLGLAAQARAQTHYTTQPRGNIVKIEGTSSAHDWEMKGNIIGGFIELGPDVKFDPAASALPGLKGGKVPVKAHAFIPVRTMHSEADHLPEVMDHLMQETMKADQFTRIEFTLTDMTFKSPHAIGTPFAFDATGELSIAGTTNKVTFPITIEPVESDKIKVSGTVPLKMTSFGVTPPAPSFGLGLMRCGDDVKIIFEWILVERK
ncbi:MAG TPA: YceI family protein [Candidatus Saccharimonadales bacterium]|nr:YceI family protein [Candidatus Saccharimonadales bacterium]